MAQNDAADWFVRLHEARSGKAVRERFVAWLLLSPANVDSYLYVSRMQGAIRSVTEDVQIHDLVMQARASHEATNVIQLAHVVQLGVIKRSVPGYCPPGHSEDETPFSRLQAWAQGVPRYAIAAASAGVLAIILGLGWKAARLLSTPAVYVTEVGEQRNVLLPDGSVIYVNTNSELAVWLSLRERRVALRRGEARFTVAKDARRPFIVATPQTTVRAIGTVFNVRIIPQGTSVAVLEGQVAVGPTRKVTLNADQRMMVTTQGKMLSATGPSVGSAQAWPAHRLMFPATGLAEAVEEFNRYYPRQMRVPDPQLRNIEITGVFDTYGKESFLQYLNRYHGVAMEIAPNGEEILVRKASRDARLKR